MSAGAMLAAIAGLDFLTGYRISLFTFYFVPVSIAAWYAGRWPAILSALLAGACWGLVDHLTGHAYSSVYVGVWETSVRLLSFLVIALAVDAIRRGYRREQELSAAVSVERERLAVTLQSIGDAVIATDVSARVSLMNSVAEELTGWASRDAAGRAHHEVFRVLHEQSRTPCSDPVTEALKTGRVVKLANHTALVARDGTERSIADSGAPIRDRAGRIIGAVLVFRDVTDEKRRDAIMARVHQVEALGVLAGGIAHDFNNILTGVLGNVSAAIEDPSAAPIAPVLSDIRRAALQARDLTRQLLTFSKGGVPIRRLVSVAQITRDTATLCTRGWDGVCEFDLPSTLWPARVDGGQIAQVVQNLVLNAKEAKVGGRVVIRGRNLHIGDPDVRPLPTGPYLRLTVANEGPEIPTAIRERIFEPFFTTKAKGTGLGLAIVHSIVARHDGLVTVGAGNEELGVDGTTFDVYLPAEPEAPPEVDAREPEDHLIRCRVLVMDDDESVRHVAVRALSSPGWEVETAENGERAVAMFQRARDAGRPYDVVIVDATVPGAMGGAETLDALMRLDPRTTVILSSGYSQEALLASHASRGFAAVLEKPYDATQMRRVVSDALASRRPG